VQLDTTPADRAAVRCTLTAMCAVTHRQSAARHQSPFSRPGTG